MKWSLNLGRVFGIKVQIHWTFLLLIGWVIFSGLNQGWDWNSIFVMIVFVLTVFACVVLHELGHALTARQYGVPTRKITLLPIGGVASLERMPEDPKQELLIAIAGPAVNVVIAGLLFIVMLFSPGFLPESTEALEEGFRWSFFFPSLLSVNVILVVFNAIPAFPMDGGRVLRALLSMRTSRLRATQIASNLGQLLAIGFVIAGFFYNPWLIFIGLFVFLGAYSENAMVQQTEHLRDHLVREAMITRYSAFGPEDTIDQAVKDLLAGSDEDFIIQENGTVKGIITRSDLIDGLKAYGGSERLSRIMEKEFETVGPEEKLTKVFPKVATKSNAVIPVIEDGQIVGVLNRENINEFIMVQSAHH